MRTNSVVVERTASVSKEPSGSEPKIAPFSRRNILPNPQPPIITPVGEHRKPKYAIVGESHPDWQTSIRLSIELCAERECPPYLS
jgi:hypothetical protein